MQNINSVINLLADKNCNNCRHFFMTWCGQDHNKESICDGTCNEWTKKDSDVWNFSIPKNPCGEVALSEYTVCCIERKNDK